MKDIACTELSGIKIRALGASDNEEGCYALFEDNRLFFADTTAQTLKELAVLRNIRTVAHGLGDGRLEGKELEISITYHHPYICVTERFGVNAALYSLSTGIVLDLRREDYHCDVSSYSVGFLEHNSRVLLICQTQWNRLDIIDAETGENLTEREVYYRETGQWAENGPVYDKKNYMDYFHSRLHVAPDGKHFLSNGWHWHPMGQIYLFETSEFLRAFELGCISTDCDAPYNWDRPCTFISNDTFVIALDDIKKSGIYDEEDLANYEYFQLAFFKTDAELHTDMYGHRWIEPSRKIKTSAFTPQSEGGVVGLLFYDQPNGYLVALTHDRGAFAVSLEGDILANLADVTLANKGIFKRNNYEIGWNYSTEHHVFYTWKYGIGIIEKKLNI